MTALYIAVVDNSDATVVNDGCYRIGPVCFVPTHHWPGSTPGPMLPMCEPLVMAALWTIHRRIR